jgi:glycosyltransferase involved in cell wall biosynthesis
VPPVSQPEPPPPPPFPKVTAIIVSRDTKGALRQTLQALEKSAGREQIEIIVVDLASRDGSAEIDAEMPAVTVLRLTRHFGKTRARNIAIRSATGDYLLFLEPGVELPRSALEQLAKTLEANSDTVAAAPRLMTPEGAVLASAYSLPSPELLAAACRTNEPLPMAEPGETAEAVRDDALLVRKVFIAGMNYFDEKRYAQFCADLDLFRQIRHAGKKVRIPAGIHATVHPVPDPDLNAQAAALRQSDRILGAAAWVSRTYGFGAGLAFRLKLTFGTLFGNFSVFWHLLSGQRIDGTQTGALQ